jgi:hypothetical protein
MTRGDGPADRDPPPPYLSQSGLEHGLAMLQGAVHGLPQASATLTLQQQELLSPVDDRHDLRGREGGERAPARGDDRLPWIWLHRRERTLDRDSTGVASRLSQASAARGS